MVEKYVDGVRSWWDETDHRRQNFFPGQRYIDDQSVAMISWNVLGVFYICSRGNTFVSNQQNKFGLGADLC